MEPAVEAGLNSISVESLSHIFSFLSPADLAAAACTHSAWRLAVGQEEGLWGALCESRFSLTSPTSPEGIPLPGFKAAFGAWHSAFGRYGQLAARALRAWRLIETWTGEHFPPVAASLRPGASEALLDAVEAELGVKLCPALRVLYRVHDGQELEFDRQVDKQRTAMHESVFHGMFGGYAFYNHMVSTRMLPLRRLVRWTRTAHTQLGFPAGDQRVLIAASHNFGKMIYCSASDGMVRVASVDKSTCLDAVPAGDGACDGVLRWFEAYAEALSAGRFAVEALELEYAESRSISLFPQLQPWCSQAVTEGVRVEGCPLFIPELTQASDPEPSYFFAYSIRFSLLPEQEQQRLMGTLAGPRDGVPLPSVQLRSRHWVIRDASGAVESEVRGEAVVGMYPLLIAGEPRFAYQSCTHQKAASGSMEGNFKFVEGSLSQPGREFDVSCARFNLVVPDVVF